MRDLLFWYGRTKLKKKLQVSIHQMTKHIVLKCVSSLSFSLALL